MMCSKVRGRSRVDHGVDLDRPLGLVAQLKMKAILAIDPVDSSVAPNLAAVRHDIARDRIGKQRGKIGARYPHFAGSAAGAERIAQHIGEDLRRGAIERRVQRCQRQRPPDAPNDLRRLPAFEQPIGDAAIAADIPARTSSASAASSTIARDRTGRRPRAASSAVARCQGAGSRVACKRNPSG